MSDLKINKNLYKDTHFLLGFLQKVAL